MASLTREAAQWPVIYTVVETGTGAIVCGKCAGWIADLPTVGAHRPVRFRTLAWGVLEHVDNCPQRRH